MALEPAVRTTAGTASSFLAFAVFAVPAVVEFSDLFWAYCTIDWHSSTHRLQA